MRPRFRGPLPLRAVLACCALAHPAGAQHARALRAGPVPPALALDPAAWREAAPPAQTPPGPTPSAWRYVATGALVGGAVAAAVIGVAYAQARDTECMTCVLFIPPVLVGGAALGAGTGYVVHRIRFR